MNFQNIAAKWVLKHYGIQANLSKLAGYEDINFLVTTEKEKKFVLKISGEKEIEHLESQNQILLFLQRNSEFPSAFPKIVAGTGKSHLYTKLLGDQRYHIRLLTYLEGRLWHQTNPNDELYQELGKFLGSLNQCLRSLNLPALILRNSQWDLQNAMQCMQYLEDIVDPHYRRIAWYFLKQYERQVVPRYQDVEMGIIHGDANDYNLLVTGKKVSGLIDFGDACYSHLIHELAVAISYIIMNASDALSAACLVTKGYHSQRALSAGEIEMVYYLVTARLSTSLCISSYSQKQDPTNKYVALHQTLVKQRLDWLLSVNPLDFEKKLKNACSLKFGKTYSIESLRQQRFKHISRAQSLSYKKPLIILRGALQYLYDHKGNAYLDAVNNISHVGHCHPAVISASEKQMAELNTNTRYLYPQLNDFADEICSRMPDPLSAIFFVNSGTEANELALRLARNYTGEDHMLVIEGAYHGNSAATLEISPYKYRGAGGFQKKPFVHELWTPDLYRGRFRAEDPHALLKYLEQQQKVIDALIASEGGLAGFICESLLGCAGQIVLPFGYLQGTYQQVRNAGGVCIADEVQVGFGRVGTHFWGYQTQGVVPDIVTIGKPMGNGHPLAAVVTTAEIANSFNNGMEYFNSFGGNPVSCEIGKAVLEILKKEHLQENAFKVGTLLKSQLIELKEKHYNVGDVRGLGLFLGVELVENRHSKKPAPDLAIQVVERMKNRGVLLGIDGPDKNVIKIKPPMVFTQENGLFLTKHLDLILRKL